jgi:hypothetical protein
VNEGAEEEDDESTIDWGVVCGKTSMCAERGEEEEEGENAQEMAAALPRL